MRNEVHTQGERIELPDLGPLCPEVPSLFMGRGQHGRGGKEERGDMRRHSVLKTDAW